MSYYVSFSNLPQVGAGQLVHNQQFTVSGSGFGTKSTGIITLIRDTGTDPLGTVSSQWDSFNPTSANGAAYALQNHAIGFQPTSTPLGAPHPYVSAILAGSMTAGGGTDAGGVQKNFSTGASLVPFVLYASWYERCNPDWLFNTNSPPDNNFKLDAWSTTLNSLAVDDLYSAFNPSINSAITGMTLGNPTTINVTSGVFGPTGVTVYVYNLTSGPTAMNGVPVTMTSANGSNPITVSFDSTGLPAWVSGGIVSQGGTSNNNIINHQILIENDTMGLVFPDVNGHGSFWNAEDCPWHAATGVGSNGVTSGWLKHEIKLKTSSVNAALGSGGGWYWRMTDGNLGLNYQGATDNPTTPNAARNWFLGGFTRMVATAGVNWRCFADFFVDSTASNNGAIDVAKVYVSNNSSGRVPGAVYEPQIISSWSNSAITFTFWKGALAGGQPAWIFVETESGTSQSFGPYTVSYLP